MQKLLFFYNSHLYFFKAFLVIYIGLSFMLKFNSSIYFLLS